MGSSRSGSDEDTFEDIEGTVSARADTLTRGGFICVDGAPYRITDVTITPPFKGRPVMALISTEDIVQRTKTASRLEIRASSLVRVPLAEHHQYTVIDLDTDDVLSLLGRERADVREDLTLPPGDPKMAAQIRLAFRAGKEVVVEVVKVLDVEAITNWSVWTAAAEGPGTPTAA
jgi:translation elongation factor P/translation initiation factor 5A